MTFQAHLAEITRSFNREDHVACSEAIVRAKEAAGNDKRKRATLLKLALKMAK